MQSLLRKNIHLLAVLSILGQGLIYTLIGRLSTREGMSVNSLLDDRIPYLSWFVLSYASWMLVLYVAFVYLGLTNRSLYWRTILTYNAAVMASNFIFIAFPTYMPRPELSGNDLFTWLVQFIYSNDAPVNCFPSIHCLTSYLLLITLNRHKLLGAGMRTALSVFLWSIIASTLFIKQHGLADVVGGILLAETTYRIVYYIADRQRAAVSKERPGTGTPMGG